MYYCWLGMAIAVISFAFLVSLTRMIIPVISDYRTNFEDIASTQLGRPVKVGKIEGEWTGLWPKIHLSNVRILSRDASINWIRASDVWLSVDLLSLVTHGRMEARRVKVNGLKLNVHRTREAAYRLNGESFRLDQASPGYQADLVSWFFSRDRLQLTNSQFLYRDDRYSTQTVNIDKVNLTLQNEVDTHHVYGNFVIPGKPDSTLAFVIDMDGDLLRPQKVVNNFYLNGKLYVSRWLQEWARPIVQLKQGNFLVRIWGQGYLKKMQQMTVQLDAREMIWKTPLPGKEPVQSRIKNLAANIFWRRQGEGWGLDIEDFSFFRKGGVWPVSDIHLAYNPPVHGRPASLEGSIAYIGLQDTGVLLSNNLPDSLPVKHVLANLNVNGILKNTRFIYQYDDKRSYHFSASTVLTGLGINRWKTFPGIKGLSGKLVIDGDRGVLKLDSTHGALDFGKLFIKPLSFQVLKGDIFWGLTGKGLEIVSDRLVASNDHIQTLSRAKVIMPAGGGSPFVDMQVDFKNGDVAHGGLYFPREMVRPATMAWLDRAFISGHVPSGKMLFHGRTADFPFTDGQGTFLVDFDVEEMTLDYGKPWPRLSALYGNVLFTDNSLLIKLAKGQVMKTDILPSRLKIEDLQGDSVLDMDMKLSGKTGQLIRYIQRMPIRKEASEFLSNIVATGTMNTAFKMSIPFTGQGKNKLSGRTKFNPGNLKLADWNQEFTNVEGILDFNYDGDVFRYSSNNIRAEYKGKSIPLTVKTRVSKNRDVSTTISMKTRMGVRLLLSSVIDKVPDRFKGESDWDIALTFYKTRSLLSIKSDLSGIAVALPDYFSKTAASRLPFLFEVNFSEGKTGPVRVKYGDKLSSVVDLKQVAGENTLERGELVFGKGPARLPTEPGFIIKGNLRTLSIGKWLDLFPGKKRGTISDSLTSITSNRLAVKLYIQRLITGQLDFNKVYLDVRKHNRGLQLDVNSAELAGEIIVPEDLTGTVPVKMDLKYLQLSKPEKRDEGPVPDPRKLPALEIKSARLVYNKKNLGALKLITRKVSDGIKIDNLSIRGPLIKADARGSWLFKNSWHESRIDLVLKAPRIDQAMGLFGYQTNIEGGKLEAELQASWPGPPHWLEMKRLNGNLHLSIKKGQLKKVNPGGGRIFGLLSIQTLSRRLSLDFSDLFRKGLAFDDIEGNFRIADGDAYTNDLHLNGPAAKIEISGRIGLAAEDYDQVVFVTPSISSSLPILGLAGGPQVAVGLYITEKLFRKKINKISKIRYTVTGSWDNPVITRTTPGTKGETDQEADD